MAGSSTLRGRAKLQHIFLNLLVAWAGSRAALTNNHEPTLSVSYASERAAELLKVYGQTLLVSRGAIRFAGQHSQLRSHSRQVSVDRVRVPAAQFASHICRLLPAML